MNDGWMSRWVDPAGWDGWDVQLVGRDVLGSLAAFGWPDGCVEWKVG